LKFTQLGQTEMAQFSICHILSLPISSL